MEPSGGECGELSDCVTRSGLKPFFKRLRKIVNCDHNVYNLLLSSRFRLVKIHVKRTLKVKRALDYITTLFACEIIICILLDRNKIILNLIISI